MANNGLIDHVASMPSYSTDLDINGTSNPLRQFNSATDITFNGGKKQDSVFDCG